MLNPSDEKTLSQRLTPVALVGLIGVIGYLEAPRQWAKYQQRQGEISRVADLQRSNELLDQERAIANDRYGKDCLLLSENGFFAQLVPNSQVVSGINGQPLQPGLVVCDAIGGTAIVGEEGRLTKFAGNAAPEVVKKAIERASQNGANFPEVSSPNATTTEAEG
ncbi:hypothetical protein [Leptolyngbya sp. FACHB-16]|uniref:hypothetical protein n=1 Tax=unclassified Leptolyngbya TaxID=2650499 RepID=UPI001684C962|nr:hypothetical protein [Leptolyngbya sp. FACHB-16]MBD2153164.1 hypothetical protein [Leptolyngbya sp. FACHB-16]